DHAGDLLGDAERHHTGLRRRAPGRRRIEADGAGREAGDPEVTGAVGGHAGAATRACRRAARAARQRLARDLEARAGDALPGRGVLDDALDGAARHQREVGDRAAAPALDAAIIAEVLGVAGGAAVTALGDRPRA